MLNCGSVLSVAEIMEWTILIVSANRNYFECLTKFQKNSNKQIYGVEGQILGERRTVLQRLVNFFFYPMTHMSFTDLVVFPPRHGWSVTDFWGWDAHEARLRCPDDVSGDIGGCSARRALKPNFYEPTQVMVTAEILPFRENSHGRTGNRTRDLMISSQRLWTLDHEAGE